MAETKLVKDWDGPVPWTYEGLRLAVLVEIREELKALNRVMQCSNVARGFQALAKIARRDEKAFKRRVEHAVAKRVKRAKPPDSKSSRSWSDGPQRAWTTRRRRSTTKCNLR